MSKRKKRNEWITKPWEGTGGKPGGKPDFTANITLSMMKSPAWCDLTAQEKTLYLTCKMQYWAETREKGADREQFTMNQSKWADMYHLYKRTNGKGFIRDMNGLIEHGFIDCVFSGKLQHTKSRYRYSDRWQKWGTPEFTVPAAVRTTARPKATPPRCSQDTGPAADQQGEPLREEITQADQDTTTTAAALEDSTGPADQTQDKPSEAEQNAAKLKAQAIAAMRASM